MPFFSVIIPTYNSELTLPLCLESLRQQSFKDFEVLVVDNRSSDRTVAIVNEYLIGLSHKVIEVNNGGVVATSRNAGLKEASGVWVAFLDSDDWWHPEKLLRCFRESDNVDLIYHQLRYYRLADTFVQFGFLCPTHALYSYNAYAELEKNGGAITTSACAIRTDFCRKVGSFDESPDLVGGEDIDYWLRCAAEGARVHYLHEELTFYLYGGNNHVTNVQSGLRLNFALRRKYEVSKKSNAFYWLDLSLLRLLLKTKDYRLLFAMLRKIAISRGPSRLLFLFWFGVRRLLMRISNITS